MGISRALNETSSPSGQQMGIRAFHFPDECSILSGMIFPCLCRMEARWCQVSLVSNGLMINSIDERSR